MKLSLPNASRGLGVSVLLAALAGLWPAPARASVFVYDAYSTVTPVLPQNLPASPWVFSSGNIANTGTITNNLLHITDTNGSSGPSWDHSLTLLATDQYEARTRLRVLSGNGGSAASGYMQSTWDNTKFVAWGETTIGSTNRFAFLTSGNADLGGQFFDITGDAATNFHQVFMQKVGTTGGAGDTVTLYIDGTSVLSTSYANFSSVGNQSLDVGSLFSAGQVVADLSGFSFGVNAPAPLLLDSVIPEPSTVILGGLGALLLAWRRRRQV